MKNIDRVKKGDWIFTCRMQPVQFSHIDPKDPKDYYKPFLKSLNDEELSNFLNDFFETMDGSSHSFKHCGCEVISETYAKWFLNNSVHRLFDQFDENEDRFKLYEDAVKNLCQRENIKYEGI